MIEKEDVGRAIRRLRGERNQKDVARRAGINKSSWSGYENGNRMPEPDTYSRIAHGLGCPEEELDRAVIRQWRQRLDGGGGRGPGGAAAARDPRAGVTLTAEESLDLATNAKRIHEAIERALLRREPPERG